MKIFFTRVRCVLLLAASFQALSLFAQGQTPISGLVTDESKQVVPGISVTVKGTTTGGITNGSGNYSFQLPAGASVLVFSGVGFARKEVNIDGQK